MKVGLGADGKVLRAKRISKEGILANESSLNLAADDSQERGSMVKRRSSLEAAESRRGSRNLQARASIQNVNGGTRGSISGAVFEKTMDPRTLARIEFEEAKRLAKEFHMDFNEVKEVIDVFYTSDEDETGGLDKKELERALARVMDVHVVPAKDVEKAWSFMIGKRPMAMERALDEVTIETFFHWYVEHIGNRVVSRSVRATRPSLVTMLGSSASASAVVSKLPPAVAKLLPQINSKTSISSPSTSASTRPSTSPSKSDGLESPSLPVISVQSPTTESPPVRSTGMLNVPVEPLSPASPTSPFSEPLSPLTPVEAPRSMSDEQIEELRTRFNRFAEGSGVRGVLFYPQFILMFCDLYRIPTPQGIHQKWINSLWREIDVEKCGSVNFEAFCDWYMKYFDPATGRLSKGMQVMVAEHR
jgi:Ca2+-binding EF-hand superfamily protein